MAGGKGFFDHHPALVGYATKHFPRAIQSRWDPEDVVQATYVTAMTTASPFVEGELGAYLMTLLKHELSEVRERETAGKRDIRRTKKITSPPATLATNPVELAQEGEFWGAVQLRGGLDTLPQLGRRGKLPEPRGREPQNAKERWNWLHQERSGRGRETLELVRRFI